jgi:hypothetical protein
MKQRITLYVDAQTWRDFRAACVKRGRTASQVVSERMQEQVEAWARADQDTQQDARARQTTTKRRSTESDTAVES